MVMPTIIYARSRLLPGRSQGDFWGLLPGAEPGWFLRIASSGGARMISASRGGARMISEECFQGRSLDDFWGMLPGAEPGWFLRNASRGGARMISEECFQERSQDDFWGMLPGAEPGWFLRIASRGRARVITEGLDMLKLPYRKPWANSVDPDQTPQNATSDQGLQFATHSAFLHTFTGSKMDLLKRSIR